MAKEFDPNNLTAGDVVRAVAPMVAAILAIYLVHKFAPDFVGIAFVALIGLVFYFIFTMPKKDLEAIGKADKELGDKIGDIPIVGPVAKPLWQVFDWLGVIIGAISLLWLVVWAVKRAL
ncbi:MAG: hypothetical protein WBM57_12495 [Woeseiaceae bacterium]